MVITLAYTKVKLEQCFPTFSWPLHWYYAHWEL